MADQTIKVDLGEGTKENVALKLTEMIMWRERENQREWTRAQILDLYAECLEATWRSRETKT